MEEVYNSKNSTVSSELRHWENVSQNKNKEKRENATLSFIAYTIDNLDFKYYFSVLPHFETCSSPNMRNA